MGRNYVEIVVFRFQRMRLNIFLHLTAQDSHLYKCFNFHGNQFSLSHRSEKLLLIFFKAIMKNLKFGTTLCKPQNIHTFSCQSEIACLSEQNDYMKKRIRKENRIIITKNPEKWYLIMNCTMLQFNLM